MSYACPRHVLICPVYLIVVFTMSLWLCPRLVLKSQHIPNAVFAKPFFKQKASAKTYKGNQKAQPYSITHGMLWTTFPRVGGRMRERMSEREEGIIISFYLSFTLLNDIKDWDISNPYL